MLIYRCWRDQSSKPCHVSGSKESEGIGCRFFPSYDSSFSVLFNFENGYDRFACAAHAATTYVDIQREKKLVKRDEWGANGMNLLKRDTSYRSETVNVASNRTALGMKLLDLPAFHQSRCACCEGSFVSPASVRVTLGCVALHAESECWWVLLERTGGNEI